MMHRTRSRWLSLGVLATAALALAASGCGVVDALDLQKPTARIAGVALQDIDLKALTLRFDVEVENPYSVDLPLVNLDYGLASRGASFLSGKADIQGSVPARGKKTVSLPARVTYENLLSVLKDVKLGSVVPYQADLGLSVNTPVAGPLRLPLKKEGELPIPAPPQVSVQEIQWDDLTLERAGGTVKLHLVNRNQFPVNMANLAYGLSLANVDVASASITRSMQFAADGGAGTIDIPIALSPRKLGLAAFSMVTGKGADYKLTGAMDVKTPFGPMSLPIEGIGKTIFRR